MRSLSVILVYNWLGCRQEQVDVLRINLDKPERASFKSQLSRRRASTATDPVIKLSTSPRDGLSNERQKEVLALFMVDREPEIRGASRKIRKINQIPNAKTLYQCISGMGS